MVYHRSHIQCEEDEEEEKVLVVLVAQTIVDEGAVMIEPLDALVAIVAVHSVLRAKILAVDANIVEMQLFIYQALHEAEEVLFERDIPWIYQRHAVEEDCK